MIRRVASVVGGIGLGASVLDLCSRALARRGLLGDVGADPAPWAALVALLAYALLMWALTSRRARVFALFSLAFAVGVMLQLRLGARLQSDGFYYYAYLRSLWFDHDVNFLNDYRLLSLGDKAYLFQPTVTDHAQSAWTIGPAIVWAPFFAIGHIVATFLSARGTSVATDGTSFPYRQSVCLAGLFYGLLGVYFCQRIAEHFTARAIAASAAALGVGGSFMLWYFIREPSMTHAPAMAAVAAFVWLWIATLERRTAAQWIGLGALGGLMALIRWQNAIYGLLPLCEFIVLAHGAFGARDRRAIVRLSIAGAAGFIAAVVVFLPQMLAWNAIYGAYFAVSPLGPQIQFRDPHLVEVLWSSRNGLFAVSPVLYAGALGLPFVVKRHRLAGVAMTVAFLTMVYFNSIIQDWWGSEGFGGRRFDGAIPLLIVGLACVIDALRRLIARAPWAPGVLLLTAAAVWELTFHATMRAGVTAGDRPNDFGVVSAAQADTWHRWVGHPFAFPANVLFAVANATPIADYDLVDANSFLGDPNQPYGRIDVGAAGDTVYLREGFSDPERDGPTTYRWADDHAALIIPLRRSTRLHVELRLRTFGVADAPPLQLTVRINDRPFGPLAVPVDWQTISFVADRDVWRTTINRVTLSIQRAGGSGTPVADPHPRLAVDFIRIREEGR